MFVVRRVSHAGDGWCGSGVDAAAERIGAGWQASRACWRSSSRERQRYLAQLWRCRLILRYVLVLRPHRVHSSYKVPAVVCCAAVRRTFEGSRAILVLLCC